MRRPVLALPVIVLISASAYAVDPGKAVGSVVVDGGKINLNYAYAVNHQKNEVSNRRDDTRIVMTDKTLPDNIKLEDIDYSFPDGVLGVVVCVTHDQRVSHVIVQHPKGMYDAGFFENDQNYHYKPVKGELGTISGNLSSNKITTNTMAFWFNIDFNALVK